MALPASLSPTDLKKLDDRQILKYFCKHARMTDSSDPDHKYAIRFGSITLFDADTNQLRFKFEDAIMEFRPPKK